jgi:hypothetical protein
LLRWSHRNVKNDLNLSRVKSEQVIYNWRRLRSILAPSNSFSRSPFAPPVQPGFPLKSEVSHPSSDFRLQIIALPYGPYLPSIACSPSLYVFEFSTSPSIISVLHISFSVFPIFLFAFPLYCLIATNCHIGRCPTIGRNSSVN